MDGPNAKRVALLASFGACLATAAGGIARDRDWSTVSVAVATFGLAAATTALAEVAPGLASSLALTVLVTALFAISDAPWKAVGNLSSVN